MIVQPERHPSEQTEGGEGSSKALQLLESPWLGVTLYSIGDAVIATDSQSIVTFVNPVAETLTGWSAAEAVGQPLEKVFRIVNESSRLAVENPAIKALREGTIVGLANHTLLIARDGNERSIDDSAAPIRDQQEQIVGVVLVFRDVSEQRRAERRRNARLAVTHVLSQETDVEKAAAEILAAVCSALQWDAASFWRLGSDENVLRCRQFHQQSSRSLEAFRQALEQAFPIGVSLPGRVWESRQPLWVPNAIEDPHFVRAPQAQQVDLHGAFACPVAAGDRFLGVIEFFSQRIQPPDDDLLEMMATIGGQFGHFIERQEAEQKLRRSEQELTDFFENASVGLHWVGPDGIIQRVNQAELALLGYSREEYVGRHIADIHVDQPVIEDILTRLARGETLRDRPARMRAKDGSIRDVLINSSVLFEEGKFIHTRCFTLDVTEAKRAQQDQARLAAIVESSDDAIVSKSLEGVILSWNAGAQRIFGYMADEAIGQPIRMVIPPELQDEEDRILERLRRGERIAPYETVRMSKDGRRIDISLTISPLRDSEGQIVGASKIARDISDAKRAERALRESEERFVQFMQHLPGLAWIKDLQGHYIYANQAAAAVFQCPLEELLGKTDAELFPPETASQFQQHDQMALASESGVQTIETLEHADGVVHHSVVSKFPIPGPDGQPALVGGMAIDITKRKQAEAALQAKEAELELIASTTPLILIRCGRDLKYRFANRAAAALYGLTPDQMVGRPIADVMGEAAFAKIRPHTEQVLTGHRVEFEAELPRQEGGSRWIHAIYAPDRDEQGQVIGWIASIVDITERKRMELSQRFLAEAGKSLSSLVDYKSTLQMVARLAVPGFADWCAVDVVDSDGVLERLAVAHTDPTKVQLAERISQRYPPPGDSPRGVHHVLRTGEPELAAKIEDAVFADVAQNDEHLELLRELCLKSYICTPLKTKDRVFGAITFAFAESGRLYGPDDLAVAADLAHRAAIAIENARLYQEVRDADRRKDEFLAMLAHELRNPLSPIRTGLDLLAMSGGEHVETIALMQQQVVHVVRLVDDLLDVSRIMRGKVDLRKEPVELTALVKRSVEAVRPFIDSQSQRLTVSLPEEPIWVQADSVRLIQVFENLLNNASKYTDVAGHIELTAERQRDHAVIRVQDTGIGIEPELLPRVFELFTQSSRSLDRAQGGLGIGLTLVQRLVEMHGGSVSVHSDGPGQGSTFTVRLPTAEAAAPREAVTPPPDIQSRRVLVVDDNFGVTRMLSMLLSKLGNHEVEVADDGPSALTKIKAMHPEIVLLDVGLPGMDGYQVAKEVRKSPEFDDVLLVALTGYGQEEDRQRSKQAGFDEHLTKPPSIDQIRAVLTTSKKER